MRTLLAALALLAAPAAALDLAQLEQGKFALKVDAQAQYTVGGPRTTDAFTMKQMRFTFEAKHPQWLDLGYRVQYETVRSSGLVDGYVELAKKDLLPDLGLKGRLGQQKRPFSYESLLSDSLVELVNRSRVVETLTPGRDTGAVGGRDIGGIVESSWSPAGREKLVVGTVGVFNGEGGNTPERNKQKDLDLRMTVAPLPWLQLGGSYTNGRRFAPQQVRDRRGAEVAINAGPVHLRSEYIYGRDHFTLKDGWYVHGNYTILKDKLMASARYDEFDADKAVHGNRQKQTTVGFNWWIRKEVRVVTALEMQRDQRNENRGLFMLGVSL